MQLKNPETFVDIGTHLKYLGKIMIFISDRPGQKYSDLLRRFSRTLNKHQIQYYLSLLINNNLIEQKEKKYYLAENGVSLSDIIGQLIF